MSSVSSVGAPRPLRVCIVDMNNGHENQAMRCLRSIVSRFQATARRTNPGLEVLVSEVSPRDKGGAPPRDCDLYLSSGGPGSPFDGDELPWYSGYGAFLDHIVEENVKHGEARAKALFGVCFSFELIVRHFAFATMAPRASRKFGVMPIYTTSEGQKHPLLAPFNDRLFAFEHRNWEAIDLDERALKVNGGRVLALESREGQYDKGRAILGVDAAPGVETVQFHPEADRAGVVAWVARPDQAAAFREAYGDLTYERMLKTLDDPRRLARTFAVLIPGWMARKFNALSGDRGWAKVDAPVQDADVFGPATALAS